MVSQDLRKRLSNPLAKSGLLRLRTSPQLRVKGAFGRLFSDRQYNDLYHIIACSPGDAFVLDLEFESRTKGFIYSDSSPPTFQIAFQYSILMPLPDSLIAEWQSKHAANSRAEGADLKEQALFRLQRWLCVRTVKVRLKENCS